MPSRERDQKLITCALAVLSEAAYRSRTEAVQTPAVRLALRVLMRYLPDRAPLTAYWEAAALGRPSGATAYCRHAHDLIAAKLRARGWHAPV